MLAYAIAAYLPNRKRPRDLSGLQKNLRLGEDGRYRWHWDPKFLANRGNDPNALGERLTAASRNIRVPALLVRGQLSDVLSEEVVQEFLELVPSAEYTDVSQAAHMIVGDRNDVFTEAVVGFLAKL